MAAAAEAHGAPLPDKRYYMACLDLEGRDVLVVGGGPVAVEKVEGLLDCGARVTVVAPEVAPELERVDVVLLRRRYLRDDLEGRFLVVAATSTPSVNRQVFSDAEAQALLCNVVDVPELCSFILPAVHRVDPIAVAISTGGASPALAQRLRDEVAQVVRPEHAQLARQLREIRPWAKERFATYQERKVFFQDLVDERLG
jgi:precorrin-2 dehydrogenase / sirohydrochlorin ferrochelatase